MRVARARVTETSRHGFVVSASLPIIGEDLRALRQRFVPGRRLIFDHVARWGDYARGTRPEVVAANCQFSDHVNEIRTSTSNRNERSKPGGEERSRQRTLCSLAARARFPWSQRRLKSSRTTDIISDALLIGCREKTRRCTLDSQRKYFDSGIYLRSHCSFMPD